MNIEEKYLPIGSVVRLKDGHKNLMIIGFVSSSPQTGDKQYDYMGALYPEGVLSSDMNFLFDHENIEEVLFKGFVTDEEVTFKKSLIEFVSTGKINGNSVNINAVNSQIVNSQNLQQNFRPQMFDNNMNQ